MKVIQLSWSHYCYLLNLSSRLIWALTPSTTIEQINKNQNFLTEEDILYLAIADTLENNKTIGSGILRRWQIIDLFKK